MHIPDGFLSPATYLSAGAVAVGAWSWAGRGLWARLEAEAVPRLGVLTALAYGLGLVMLPLPGATSGHLIGVPLLALVFGVRQAFLAYSLVLLLQSLLFGVGGITALPVNSLAIGLIGAVTVRGIFGALRSVNETLAVLLAAWCGVVVAAVGLGAILGLQPLIAQDAEGKPLFFPFRWPVVLPAIVLPHLLIGIGEAAVTWAVWRFAKKRGWGLAASECDLAEGTVPAVREEAENERAAQAIER